MTSQIKTFPVTNLSCASCAGTTEAALKEQDGVVNAEVNYANSSAKSELLSLIASSEKLKQAVQSDGYDSIIDESEEPKESLVQIKKDNYKNPKKQDTERSN